MRPLNRFIELQLQAKPPRSSGYTRPVRITAAGVVGMHIHNPIADGAPLREVADLTEESP
jgi:hypothetical protein